MEQFASRLKKLASRPLYSATITTTQLYAAHSSGLDPCLPLFPVAMDWRPVPIHSHVLGLRSRGHRALRTGTGELVGLETHSPLPSTVPRRTRSCPRHRTGTVVNRRRVVQLTPLNQHDNAHPGKGQDNTRQLSLGQRLGQKKPGKQHDEGRSGLVEHRGN